MTWSLNFHATPFMAVDQESDPFKCARVRESCSQEEDIDITATLNYRRGSIQEVEYPCHKPASQPRNY